ncbi:MAG: hypothetical protein OXF41_16355 [bacterium]|nr:hypothetical protein [bacterium]
MDDEYAWPKPGMSLFETTNPHDWRANACMPYQPDWVLYQSGYQLAAELLMAHTASGKDQDLLIYPILFNARQAIELGLKETIRLGNRLLNRDGPYPKRHELTPLWQMAKGLLAEAASVHDPEALDEEATGAFEELIKALNTVDPGSFTFRYPTDQNDRPSFDAEDGIVPNQINTRDLNHTLSAMFNYLTGTTEWLANIIHTLQDMQSYSY